MNSSSHNGVNLYEDGWCKWSMISFFVKFYLICGLIYTTVIYNDDMRTQRAMMRGRPSEEWMRVGE